MPSRTDGTKYKPMSTGFNSLLAVDAGGTKTAVWLVDLTKAEGERVIGRGRSTAGNPLSVGFAEATRAISEAVARAHEDARLPVATARRAILSIAGARERGMGQQFGEWGRAAGLAGEVAIVSDVLPVLAAGTPECTGVAVISGTGSVAFARGADGRTALRGGWGYLLGDEGSGFAIGRAALQHALEVLQASAPGTALSGAVLDALKVKSVRELTATIYKNSDPRATIAAIAPLVAAVAERGDATARAVLSASAGSLAELVRRAAAAVDLDEGPFSLAAAGGVLTGAKQLQDELVAELQQSGLQCELNVVDNPLRGCVRLAAQEFTGNLVTWQ
jgi:N-acetylglucosamine kinase-like BadF-type ATPase